MNSDICFVVLDSEGNTICATGQTVIVHEVLDDEGGHSVVVYEAGNPMATHDAAAFKAEYPCP